MGIAGDKRHFEKVTEVVGCPDGVSWIVDEIVEGFRFCLHPYLFIVVLCVRFRTPTGFFSAFLGPLATLVSP